MWAVIVNVITVVAGSLVGLLARNLISKKLSDAIMLGIGACTVYIGISGALQGSNTLVLVLSMALVFTLMLPLLYPMIVGYELRFGNVLVLPRGISSRPLSRQACCSAWAP